MLPNQPNWFNHTFPYANPYYFQRQQPQINNLTFLQILDNFYHLEQNRRMFRNLYQVNHRMQLLNHINQLQHMFNSENPNTQNQIDMPKIEGKDAKNMVETNVMNIKDLGNLGSLSTINTFASADSVETIKKEYEEPIKLSNKSNEMKVEDEVKDDKIESILSTSKKIKKSNECVHQDHPHYAKNLCYSCYHKFGRDKKPWKCEHDVLYAKGLCHKCYIKLYKKKKKNCYRRKLKKHRFRAIKSKSTKNNKLQIQNDLPVVNNTSTQTKRQSIEHDYHPQDSSLQISKEYSGLAISLLNL